MTCLSVGCCHPVLSVLARLLRIGVLRSNQRNLRMRHVESARTACSGLLWRLRVRDALSSICRPVHIFHSRIFSSITIFCFILSVLHCCNIAGMLVAVTHHVSTANSATAAPTHAEIPMPPRTDTIWAIFGGARTARTGPQWRLMHSMG